MTYENINI